MLFHQQQQQRQQQGRRQQQRTEHDVKSMLKVALSNLSQAQQGAFASVLHLTSRTHRSLALSALPHLSLERFDDSQYCTCEAVYRDSLENGCFSRAVVPDPPIPWRTLADLAAAGGVLTSLDIRQCQAEPLLAGATRAATAPVLAAILAGLRCLRVTELEQYEFGGMLDHFGDGQPEHSHKSVQLQCVARLISSCSGLTKLVLEKDTFQPHIPVDVSLFEGVWTATAAEEEEEEEEQGKGEQGQVAKQQGTCGTRPGVVRLPHLQRLEVEGMIRGLVSAVVGAGVAPGLTSCKLSKEELAQDDIVSLAACSQLQELELDCDRLEWGAADGLQAFQQLMHSSALTKLELGLVGASLLPAVSVATQLRHLDLGGAGVPADLSSLQQLTFLDISGTDVEELPQQLGEWMPQLQVLGVAGTEVAAIPQGLQRLTGLRAAHSSIPSVAAVEHLVGLQQLLLHGMAPPYQQLSAFTALQELSLSISEGGAQVTPSALPLLKALRLKADDPFRAVGQLVGRGRHLTSLGLYSTWQGVERAAAVGQLGVLPVLQQLVLCMPLSSLRAAGPWLLQQPQLTSLSLAWSHRTEQVKEEQVCDCWGRYAPPCPTLQQLSLRRGVPQDGLPDALMQLKGLRVLRLSGPCSAALPAWVSGLAWLSVLQLDVGCAPKGDDAAAWAVLGQMPLLRRVEAHKSDVDGCLQQLKRDAPHLFRGVQSASTRSWDTL
jgi:hypothetical protein